jgi:hypothetical protein
MVYKKKLPVEAMDKRSVLSVNRDRANVLDMICVYED